MKNLISKFLHSQTSRFSGSPAEIREYLELFEWYLHILKILSIVMIVMYVLLTVAVCTWAGLRSQRRHLDSINRRRGKRGLPPVPSSLSHRWLGLTPGDSFVIGAWAVHMWHYRFKKGWRFQHHINSMSIEEGLELLSKFDSIFDQAITVIILVGVSMGVNLICMIVYMVTMSLLKKKAAKDRRIELGQLPDPDYPSQPLYV